MTKSNFIVIGILVGIIIIVGIVAFSDSFGNSDGVKSVSEQLQPDGTLPYTDLDGTPVDLADFEGKTLVVNAWATWCPFCVNELPDMNELAAKYENQDVVVIAINRAESVNTVKAYIETRLNNSENLIFLLDENDTYYSSIGGFAMPETVFYRKDGSAAVHKRGFMTLAEMETHVATALAPSNE